MSDGNYEVGRGKPPRHSRFQKGQSGNPAGRPKGALGLRAAFMEEFSRTVTGRENGREVRATKAQMVAKVLLARAVAGDAKAIQMVCQLVLQLEPPAVSEVVAADHRPSEIDAAILHNFVRRSHAPGGGHD